MLLAGIDIGGTKMEVSLFEVGETVEGKQFDLHTGKQHYQAKKVNGNLSTNVFLCPRCTKRQ